MQTERQSNLIQRLLDSSEAVEDSVKVHGPIVASLLEERFEPRVPEAEDGDKPHVLAFLFTLRDDLGASREAVAEIEARNIRLLRRVTGLSNERATLLESLQNDYTWLRGHLEKLLGEGQAEVVGGIQRPTATSSKKLLRQVRLAIEALSEPGVELVEKRFGAGRTDPAVVVEQLERRSARFREVLNRLDELHREVQVTQKDKNRTVEEHKRTFFSIARALEGFYRLAGEDELADRIRPSRVRCGRRAVDVEESEGGSENGGADGGGSEEGDSASVTASAAPAEESSTEESSTEGVPAPPETASPAVEDADGASEGTPASDA